MKKLFIILSLTFSGLFVHSQVDWGEITFDDTSWANYIFIDTINYPENIWQIGSPDKTIFNQSLSLPNAIVTDTINSYQINNTSVFFVRYITQELPIGEWDLTGIQFDYRIDTDQYSDFGKVEFSTDNGQTWIDYLTDTLFNDCYNYSNSNYFTGSSFEWQYFNFYIIFPESSNCFNIQPGDTLWYKFTFISDDTQTGKDGWMIDNILLWDIMEGIEDKTELLFNINAFPNPASHGITLAYQNTDHHNNMLLECYNIYGQRVHSEKIYKGQQQTKLDVSGWSKGLYLAVVKSNGKVAGRVRFVRK